MHWHTFLVGSYKKWFRIINVMVLTDQVSLFFDQNISTGQNMISFMLHSTPTSWIDKFVFGYLVMKSKVNYKMFIMNQIQ